MQYVGDKGVSRIRSNLGDYLAKRSWSSPSSLNAQKYLFVVLFISLLFISSTLQTEANATSTGIIWFLGAVSVSLTYCFGFVGLCASLVTSLFILQLTNSTQGIPTLLASLLYVITLPVTSLLPYYKQGKDNQTSYLLSDSKQTASFIATSVLASAVSVGLYMLSLNIVSSNLQLGLEDYASHVLASSVIVISVCPLLTVWKHKQKWPSLPQDPKEYSAWCMALMVISFFALSFGRSWIALCALLVIWAASRFSWFGTCLAIAITTFFVGPSTYNVPAELNTTGFTRWLFINFEYVSWFGLASASLYFASLLSDRRKSERSLESRVLERTRELDIINSELQQEIDIRHNAEDRLNKTNKRYRALIETAGIPVIVINDRYLIEHWNGASEGTTGYKYDSMLGKDFLQLCIPKEEHAALTWHLNKCAASSTSQENLEISLITSSDTHLTMLWNINFISDEDLDEHGQFLLIGQDISRIRQTQNQLHYLAHFDSLTGAANRRLFEDRCKQSIESAKRYNSQIALLSIDIDHFKKINDTLGHDGGDAFLVELMRRLERCVRKEDTIARLGGDEFAILLPNISGQDGADRVARNILEQITEPTTIKGTELTITSSIGITICPDDGDSYEKLLKNSDMAMYRAKSAGRNNLQFYCSDMNSEMLRQCRIEKELRQALQHEELCIHYQPVVDTKSGEIVALEALIRWHHPERGLVMPREFLAIADQTGVLQQIGEWAINQICIEGELISSHHFQDLPLSFNLTRKQYNHPHLIKMLTHACEANRFNPQKLILELSENTITQGGNEALKILKQLKEIGCVIAIDGFGTGTSSLSQLNALPIDIIKIGKTFIANSLLNKQNKMIVETLLAVAKQLGIKGFATGVETPAQEAFLQKNGCHYAQGYLYSEPLALAPLIEFLSATSEQRGLHSGDQITLPFRQSIL